MKRVPVLFPSVILLLVLSVTNAFAIESRPTPKASRHVPSKDPLSRNKRFLPADAVIEDYIAKQQIPGAVLLVGQKGKVIYRKAYGRRALVPALEPMTVDTIFDIASLTKSVATATSVMRMLQLGQVRLNDPIMRYL